MRDTLRGLFSSIGVIYFFILPVYIPIRALGVELKSYEQMLGNPVDLVLYFLQVMLLITCNGILLSLCYDWISKRLFKDEGLIVHWYRTTAFIYAVFFIFSSYFVLNPKNLLHLYAWSGVHYFIISFFQILIRSEINHSQNKNITTAQANNYFGVMLNICGVIALTIFSLFYSSHHSDYYSTYCLCLELGFFIYLMFGRKYYDSVSCIAKQCSFKIKIAYIIACMLVLFVASFTSLIFVISGWLGSLLLLTFIGYIYSKFKLEVDKRDLHLIINIDLGYGLVLSALSGSILAYFIRNQSVNYDSFNFAYSSEPIFSVFIGAIFTYYLIKNSIKTTRPALANSIFVLNCMVPVILGAFVMAYFKKTMISYSLVAVFGLYAILEYLSLFYVRQIAQQHYYNENQGAKLTIFNSIVLNGLCPSLLYLLVYCLAKFTSIALNQQLVVALSVLIGFSVVYNIWHRYVVKYET